MTATDTLTLTGFLLARIAEDEAAWAGGLGLVTRPDFARLSRHMLAECEAKRLVIAEAWSVQESDAFECGASEDRMSMDRRGYYPDTLRILAAVYRDHDDYREEWRP